MERGSMKNIIRILKGKLHFNYCHWQKWNHLGFKKLWSGKLIYFGFSKFSVQLDIRKNWVDDLVTGKVK